MVNYIQTVFKNEVKWLDQKQDVKIKLKSVFINHDLSSPQFFGSLISNVNVF